MQIYVNYIKVCVYFRKFILGPLLGLIMPTSLVWAQYVHPLDYPKVPQVDKIPSGYFLNFQLENPFELLEHDADWIGLKKEAFIPEQDITKIKLNTPNSYEEDFWIPEGSKTTKTSSILQQNSVFNPFNKSQDSELDNGLTLTNLIENSLKQIPITQIDNSIDPILNDSIHQVEFLDGIVTYPSHPKAFFRDSLVNQTENSRTTAGKPKDKHPTEILSYNEVLASYPVYSGITSKVSHPFFNIFELSFADRSISTSETSQALPNEPILLTSRQRRVDFDSTATYVWEIEDFSTFDSFDFNTVNTTSGNTFNIYIYPTSGKNADNYGFDFNSANQKTMGGIISGYDTIQTSKLFMNESVTGPPLDPLTSFNIDDSLWKYVHMDWASETSWFVSKSGTEYYLNYDPNGFKLSAVPEPSTYFMTGALFCLIGCNKASRNAFKSMLSKAFKHLKTKGNLQSIHDRIS